MYFSVGYFESTLEFAMPGTGDSTYSHLALTGDYTVAPGLGVYAEINMISDELLGETRRPFSSPRRGGASARGRAMVC